MATSTPKEKRKKSKSSMLIQSFRPDISVFWLDYPGTKETAKDLIKHGSAALYMGVNYWPLGRIIRPLVYLSVQLSGWGQKFGQDIWSWGRVFRPT
jgi:hypothetical protein